MNMSSEEIRGILRILLPESKNASQAHETIVAQR